MSFENTHIVFDVRVCLGSKQDSRALVLAIPHHNMKNGVSRLKSATARGLRRIFREQRNTAESRAAGQNVTQELLRVHRGE